MRFEKIAENKIRITFSLEDLECENIDFHSFMSNSIETQSIFIDMLNKAEKEFGFVTNNHKLIIEAIATSNGHFIVTVTRLMPETSKTPKKRLSVKRKTASINMPVIIFHFENFDDFCNLSSCLTEDILKRINKIFKKSILYLYKGNYYLSLDTNANANVTDVKYVLSTITEFSNCIKYSSIFQKKLNEYGKIILTNNCFLKANKFFAK